MTEISSQNFLTDSIFAHFLARTHSSDTLVWNYSCTLSRGGILIDYIGFDFGGFIAVDLGSYLMTLFDHW